MTLTVAPSPRRPVAPSPPLLLALILISLLPFISPLLHGEVFSFRDHVDYFVPLRYFTAQSLRAGELPLWNPFNGSGERWLANPQTGVFYPPAWLYVVLPFQTAYILFLWLHVLVLGAGGFLLFSRWATPPAAAIAATALMLGGPTLSLLDISNNLATFAWFPAVILLALLRRNGQSRLPLSVDALGIALLFLGGEPFLAAIGALLYAGILITRSPGRGTRDAAVVGSIAILLTAVQLLPFLELLQGSDRLRGSSASSLRESLWPGEWLGLLVRDLEQRYLPSLYLSLPILFAAVVTMVRARRLDPVRQRVVAAWLSLLAVVMIAAAGKTVPLVEWIWRTLRLDVARYPSRLVPLGVLAFLGLAAMGFDCLAQSGRDRLKMAAITLVAALAVGFFSWPYLSAALWLVVMAALLAARSGAVLILIPLLAADFLAAGQPLRRAGPFDRSLPPYDAVVKRPYKLVRIPAPSDIVLGDSGRRAWLSGYLNLLIGRFDASSPAPVISDRYLRLHEVAVREPRLDIVNFLSIGYLATRRPIYHADFEPVGRRGTVTLLRNRAARPAVQVWTYFVAAESAHSAFQRFLAESNDAEGMVQVSCRPGARCQVGAPSSPRRMPEGAPVQFPSLNEVRTEVMTASPAIVTLSQLDAPGWRVEVDGTAAEPLRANGIFRAVRVPAGRHVVRWRFAPLSFPIGAILSILGLVVAIGEAIYLCRRRGREAR